MNQPTERLGIPWRFTAPRAALLEEASKIKSKLSQKSYQSARVEAGRILRPMVVSGVSESIPNKLSLEFDRADVLQVIDSFLGRADALKAVTPAVSNGLIAVQTDRAQYATGERSGIEVVAIREPANRELEYAVGMVVNGLPQRVERVDQGKWSATSRRLESGVTSIVIQAYLQNRRDAAGFEAAKRAYEQRLLDLGRERSRETDPERILEIDRETQETEAKISQLNEALGKMRTAVGSPLEVLVEGV